MRIESNQQNMREIEQKISTMEEKLKKTRRGGIFSCFNCLLYFILIILIGVGYGFYIAAKSGLAEVPFFSERFFDAPQPYYLVPVTNEPLTDESLVKEILRQSLPQLAAGRQTAIATISFTDARLSEMLRGAIKKDLAPTDLVQVAVYEGNAEFFIHTGERLYIKIVAVPSFENGALQFTVTEALLGSLEIPRPLVSGLLNFVLGGSISSLSATLKTFGEISDLTVLDGELRVEFTVTKSSKILNAF